MKLTLWLVLVLLSLVGCSGPKSAKKVEESSPQVVLSEADDFIENSTEENVPEVTAEPLASTEATTEEEPIAINDEITPESTALVAETKTEHVAGEVKQYTVQKNETLMLIAFKLYGDYGKWKSLANENQSALNGSYIVREGMTLSYTAPAEEFVWAPTGSPYLIRTGDTLGKISKNVYQTMTKWKMLWENNRPMIKDPNKIFAGFTIYYVDGREVASGI
jgi:nucleoid-associated protein YgaU